MPPLNRKASVVVPWASLILAAGLVDMLSVCSERKARGWGVSQQSRSHHQRQLLTSGTPGTSMPATPPRASRLPYPLSAFSRCCVPESWATKVSMMDCVDAERAGEHLDASVHREQTVTRGLKVHGRRR